MIIKKMIEADGVIFASPVYSLMVSALMKNFFERFGYLGHRPRFFDKYAMSMVTCSGYGAEDALDYMAVWNAGFLTSNDLQEAVTAFMEKRQPNYDDT